jgi:hypothetical protein
MCCIKQRRFLKRLGIVCIKWIRPHPTVSLLCAWSASPLLQERGFRVVEYRSLGGGWPYRSMSLICKEFSSEVFLPHPTISSYKRKLFIPSPHPSRLRRSTFSIIMERKAEQKKFGRRGGVVEKRSV